MKNSLSILVPVYNEEEIIVKNTKKLIDFLKKMNVKFEILICSNGSTDSTVKKGKELEKKYKGLVRFFSVSERGTGLAFRKNTLEAEYENLISVDMDLSVDLNHIKEFSKLLKKYDIIIGSKQVGEQERSIIRIILSSTFIWIVKFLLDMDYTDYSMAAKAFKKKIILRHLDKIPSGSSYVINMIYLAKRDGYRIKEVPVLCEDKRQSKFNLINEIFHRFIHLIQLFIEERILKLSQTKS
jgi:glycosyltransferase involved in cell wall biosynthesis